MFEDHVPRSETEDFPLRIVENKRSRRQHVENDIDFVKLYLLSDLTKNP